MTISTEAGMRRLVAADSHSFECWMQPAKGPRRGGLVILQEIFGVTDQLKRVAEQYAAQEFEVAVPALFDRADPGTVVEFDDPARGREIMMSLDADATMADIAATVAALAAENGKVAVLGFCWGGGLALRCAQELNIAGAVAFYGTRLGGMLDKALQAPVLFHFGTRDDHSPPEVIEQVRAAYPEAEIHLYESGHAFANDARSSYAPAEAASAHRRSRVFLDRVLA